jgi:hypothetical protein
LQVATGDGKSPRKGGKQLCKIVFAEHCWSSARAQNKGFFANRFGGTADASGSCVMKTKPQLIELSLCLVCALAPVSLLTLTANSTESSSRELPRTYDRESIRGKVSAKTDATFMVDGKSIATTPGTSFTKQGKAITFADVQVGNMVKVTASAGTDGSLQAVSVEVLANE